METERQRDRETERQRDRESERQTERQTERDRQRQGEINASVFEIVKFLKISQRFDPVTRA